MDKVVIEKYFPISKIDDEQRKITGIVLEPATPDLQGDIYSAKEIEKAAHRYLVDARRVGLMHKQIRQDVVIVESYIAPSPLLINKQYVKKGTWIAVVEVNNDQIWKAVKDGKLTGFSIGGRANRTRLAA